MPEIAERRIALFIDFENLVTNTGISASNFDLTPALDRLLERGKIIYRRAYCDWSRFREATRTLHDLGVELVDVPPSTRAGKNGADMRLVIDALELCYAREHIDTYVIASGDSDFCPIAAKLRENDRFVIGLAVREATSQLFVKACDEFIYLKPSSGRRSSNGNGGSDEERKSRPRSSEPKAEGGPRTRQVPDVAREVLSGLLRRATSPLNPSAIKEAIVRKRPDFDEREHGFSTFSRMLEAMEKEGLMQRIQQGRQWYVVAREGAQANRAEAQANEAHGQEAHADEAPPMPPQQVPDEESIPDPEDEF
jgi:uncharacterized LabA/DUF88 family protein